MSTVRPFVVLKFGGTSVATAERWQRIATHVRELLPEHRVWIVASALSQVSNHLERAVEQALAAGDEGSIGAFAWIADQHEELGSAIGLDDEAMAPVRGLLAQLERLLAGIRLTREASPRLLARVMSFGELASTWLGVAALAHHGISAARVDARQLLFTQPRPRADIADRYLEAEVQPRRAVEEADVAAEGLDVVITQGFIARDKAGDTCLLGRGGSDTSAALFAALVDAARLEIWTDVHGMFTTDPRRIPTARLIRRIGYREAQELAAMGAKVLHPRCLGPVAWANIPVVIRHSGDPAVEGTVIESEDRGDPAILAVVQRAGVTLLTISTLEMWGASGFLARVFAPFEELGISVDLVATSQSAVSVTLDRIPGGTTGEAFGSLLARLKALGKITVVPRCAVVSIVGRRIRTVLHELGPAFSVFQEQTVHLVSESSEDLNLSFVVEEDDAAALVTRLHARLMPTQGGSDLFGPTWEQLTGHVASQDRAIDDGRPGRWWLNRRPELLALCQDGKARYVYDLPTIAGRARALRQTLRSIDRLHYAMKANSHPEVLHTLAAQGIAMECVSTAEVRLVRQVLGAGVPVLFTPNFCPVSEYGEALELGAEITIDGPHVFGLAPETFAGVDVAVRIDPGKGLGHHDKVRTAGAHAKFGQPVWDLDALWEAACTARARVVGLHAHVGSGILDPEAWQGTAATLSSLLDGFPDARWLDLGGGLGVVERPGQEPLDLHRLEVGLASFLRALHTAWPERDLTLRMEPGRFLVSEGGVLLAPVTQVRSKGRVRFVGLATGMNSLIRPALYGAWHGIHNLSRLGEPDVGYHHVVGPICETGDILGRDRLLPETGVGDVVLIENAGAYGRTMASSYNLRQPAEEVVLR